MCNKGGFKLARSLAIKVTLMCLMLVQPAMGEDDGTPCQPDGQHLSYGDVLAGCTIAPVTDLDIFTFQGTANDETRIVMTGTSGSSGVQLCLEIRDPGNSPIVPLVCGNNQRHDISLSLSGIYRIIITDAANDDTAVFNLSLERIFPVRNPMPVAAGEIVVGREILPVTDVDTFSFNANAGNEIQVSVTGTSGSSGAQLCAEIRGPDNSDVQTMTCGNNLTLSLSPVPVTGQYQIIITENANDDTAVFNLNVNCLSLDCPNPPPTCIVEPSFIGTTLHLDLTVGTPEPARWVVSILALARTFQLFALNLPVVIEPISGPVDIPNFPGIGRIGVLSTLTTAAGLTCTGLKTVNTGLPTLDVTPEALERSLQGHLP